MFYRADCVTLVDTVLAKLLDVINEAIAFFHQSFMLSVCCDRKFFHRGFINLSLSTRMISVNSNVMEIWKGINPCLPLSLSAHCTALCDGQLLTTQCTHLKTEDGKLLHEISYTNGKKKKKELLCDIDRKDHFIQLCCQLLQTATNTGCDHIRRPISHRQIYQIYWCYSGVTNVHGISVMPFCSTPRWSPTLIHEDSDNVI